jgi:ATP-dependent Lon protease
MLLVQLRESGISAREMCIDDDALSDIVAKYTREAGVRQLERQLASVCRHVALKVNSKLNPLELDLSCYANTALAFDASYVAVAVGTGLYCAEHDLDTYTTWLCLSLVYTVCGAAV